jgi:hypothetical protein
VAACGYGSLAVCLRIDRVMGGEDATASFDRVKTVVLLGASDHSKRDLVRLH